MPRLFIDGVETHDPWCHLNTELADEEDRLTVSIERWRQERTDLTERAQRRGAALGVRIKGHDDPGQLQHDLGNLGLIVIEIDAKITASFSAFSCSMARI